MFNNTLYLGGFVPVYKTGIRYKLDKSDGALIFQVLDQSPDVSAFLEALNGGTFLTSTGFKIGASKYPEFKHSKNIIFLRGSDKSNDFKPDVTRFAGNMQRDNAYDLFKTTIQEFVDAVKQASATVKVDAYKSHVFPNYRFDNITKVVKPRKRNRVTNPVIYVVS